MPAPLPSSRPRRPRVGPARVGDRRPSRRERRAAPRRRLRAGHEPGADRIDADVPAGPPSLRCPPWRRRTRCCSSRPRARPSRIHNVLLQLQGDPSMTEALKQLDSVGGIDGLIDWIDDVGVVVGPAGRRAVGRGPARRQGRGLGGPEADHGRNASSASARSGSDIEVSTATVEGVKVTTVHIPDISALAERPSPGAPARCPRSRSTSRSRRRAAS